MKNKELHKLIVWFNQLADNKRDFILDCLRHKYSVKMSNYILAPEELDCYGSLIDNVLDVISESENEKEFKKYLAGYPLEPETIKLLYNNLHAFIVPKQDSKQILKMDNYQFEQVVRFVIDEMFLCREYYRQSPKSVAYKLGFDSTKDCISSLRFIHHQITLIADRSACLKNLILSLKLDYQVNVEKIEILEKYITENLAVLYQAHLVNRLNRLNDTVNDIKNDVNDIKNDVDDIKDDVDDIKDDLERLAEDNI